MKFEMELHPNFVSDIVVQRLQEMYEFTKEHYFDTDPVEARAAIALVLDYFMPPSDYEQWRADNGFDRNLAEEVVEGFDQLERTRVESYIERLIEEKLKNKTTKREWVGLTDNQVEKIRSNSQAFEDPLIYCIGSAERKLKELNA